MIKRVVIAYSISGGLALFAITRGLYGITDPQIKLLLVVVVPIVLFIISDKITTLIQNKKDIDELGTRLIKAIPQVESIIVLDNSHDAFDYMLGAINQANRIYNTKISVRDDINISLRSRQSKFEQLMKKAMKNGTDYSVASTRKYEADMKRLEEYAIKNNTKGRFKYKMIANSNLPHINFLIFEYPDRLPEILLGWAIVDDWDHTKQVFIIRESRLVNYFIQLHGVWMS